MHSKILGAIQMQEATSNFFRLENIKNMRVFEFQIWKVGFVF